MQFGTLPGEQPGGAYAVFDGVMAVRLPRPHRDDVRIAIGGLFGGLFFDDPRTSKDALAVIRENSVEWLAGMCRLIGILQDSGGDREPSATATVKTHVSRLLGKLEPRSRAQAAVLAQELGIRPGRRCSGPDLLTYGPDLSILAALWA
jgi:hypothetical protein